MKKFTKAPLLRNVSLMALAVLTSTSMAWAKPSGPAGSLDDNQWIVFDQATFYPVMDSVHALLNSAYKDFSNGKFEQAAIHLKAGADSLREQADDLKPNEAFRSRSAAAKLDWIAGQLKKKEVSRSEMQMGIERAYLADWAPQVIEQDSQTVIDILDMPGEHMAKALEDYQAGQYQDAAFELRQAATYMDLGGAPDPAGDALRRLAFDATLSSEARPSLKGFREIVNSASKVYADNQMDQADMARDVQQGRAHLKAAVSAAKVAQKAGFSQDVETTVRKVEKRIHENNVTTKDELKDAVRELRQAL